MSNKPNHRKKPPKPGRRDTRIVYSMCTWWGSIYDTSTAEAVPTCPYCGSPLFECENLDAFYDGLKPYPGEDPAFTREFVEWCRHPTPCSRTREEAMDRFLAQR